MPVKITVKGNWKKTKKFLGFAIKRDFLKDLDKYGREGVEALRAATPKDTGKTADSWDYEIHKSKGKVSIVWTNSNIAEYIPVALLIQYGHATGNGAYIEGIDYINPAMKPIFEKIANSAWNAITSYDVSWN